MKEYDNKEAMAFFICLRRIRHTHSSEVFQTLSSAEFFVLFSIESLSQSEEGESAATVRVSAIAEKMKVSPQAISKLLRNLEKKAYIQRITDETDRRNTLVILTEQGSSLLKKTRDMMEEFAHRVVEKMGKDDMREFIRLVNKCSDIMDETTAELLGTQS